MRLIPNAVVLASFALAVGTAHAGAQPARSAALTDHVIIISIDGLRPDAIAAAGARHLGRLQATGAWSHSARTVFPSKTLPSHTSMVTGVGPDVHGITWNTDRTGEVGPVGVPTIFDLALEHDLTSAAFFSKSKLHHLHRPGALDHFQAPTGVDTWMATRTVADVVNYLEHSRPNLLMVHISEPDAAGHALGWGSFLYNWSVRRADGAVGRILQAADEAFGAGAYTVIVTADHGGHGRDHGTASDDDSVIPWIAWGQGVVAGALGDGIHTTDTAATVLWLLGVPRPDAWTGEPVLRAFAPAGLAEGVGVGSGR